MPTFRYMHILEELYGGSHIDCITHGYHHHRSRDHALSANDRPRPLEDVHAKQIILFLSMLTWASNPLYIRTECLCHFSSFIDFGLLISPVPFSFLKSSNIQSLAHCSAMSLATLILAAKISYIYYVIHLMYRPRGT
jgi:hypothetical protein